MKRALRWLCLFFLLSFSFRQAAQLRELSPSVSLRFGEPLTMEQVSGAWTYAQAFGAPWASFWTEGPCTVSGVEATAIRFAGDARLAFPAEYRFGAPPNDLTEHLCAVSTELAWTVYGAVDITGLKLTVDGAEYTVCGVFDHGQAVVLYPAREGFTAAELADLPASADAYRYARDFAAACGLGVPTELLCGPDLLLLAELLPWLGTVVCALTLFLRLLRRIGSPAVWWCGAFALVVSFPVWAQVLPGWWFPAGWSDSAWWTSLGESLCARFRDWLTVSPAMRDVPVKLAWIRLLAASGMSLLFAKG